MPDEGTVFLLTEANFEANFNSPEEWDYDDGIIVFKWLDDGSIQFTITKFDENNTEILGAMTVEQYIELHNSTDVDKPLAESLTKFVELGLFEG